MKTLSISQNDDVMSIVFTKELNCRKERLCIDEKIPFQKCNLLKDTFGKSTLFLKCSVYYDGIDSYTNDVDIYEVPSAYFIRGRCVKIPTITSVEFGYIPKDWEEVQSISIKIPKTITLVKKIVNYFGYVMNDNAESNIRKILKKEQKEVYIEF